MVGAEKQFDPSLIVSIVHALLLPSASIVFGFPHTLQLIDVFVYCCNFVQGPRLRSPLKQGLRVNRCTSGLVQEVKGYGRFEGSFLEESDESRIWN
jgi:hypothetical protein